MPWSRWIEGLFCGGFIEACEGTVHCHFVREEVRDVEHGGNSRREVFFSARPDLQGRDVLVLDAVLESGVTQDFLLRRLGETKPRSLRLAVLLDKTSRRRVALEPDYFGFRTASKAMWVGYGLAATNGTDRNLKICLPGAQRRLIVVGGASARRSRRGQLLGKTLVRQL